MKNKYGIIAILLLMSLIFNIKAQELEEKNFFESKRELGGEVVIQKSFIKNEDGKSFKVFEIESEDNNNYYLSTWMTGPELKNFGSNLFLNYENLIKLFFGTSFGHHKS